MYVSSVCMSSRDGCGALRRIGAHAFIHVCMDRPTDRAIESSVAMRTIDEDNRFVDRSIDRSFASIESVDGCAMRARGVIHRHAPDRSRHQSITPSIRWMDGFFGHPLCTPGSFSRDIYEGHRCCHRSMTIDRFSSITFIDVSRCSSITIDRCRDDDDDDDDGGDGSGCRVDRSCAWDRDEG